MIESTTTPFGLLTILDDSCLAPGVHTDATFLADLDKAFMKNPHYASFECNDKSCPRDSFVVKHYAGDVTYASSGFMDKNNDLLFRDLKIAMTTATNLVTKSCFPAEELESKKRPPTAGTQFRGSMNALMDTLMAKEPSYVRCIKPNDNKKPGEWDESMILHQVKYLGLMENLRVARAGYCFRRPFEPFLERYKSLCPSTWPHWTGDPAEGVKALTDHLKFSPGEVAVGKSKVFIRNPKSVTMIEEAFLKRKSQLATMIAAKWKGFVQRRKYLKLKAATILAQKYARAVAGRIHAARRQKAILVLREFIQGFIHRKETESDKNRRFVRFAKVAWLEKAAKIQPTTVLDRVSILSCC